MIPQIGKCSDLRRRRLAPSPFMGEGHGVRVRKGG